jgi:hypothetical protein
MGRNKDKDDSSQDHVARPLSDLQDPASFAPPPRRTGTGLAPAPPPVSAKRKVVASPSTYADPRAGPVEPPPRNTGVLAIEAAPTEEDDHGESHQPKPYRMNTTSLSTAGLPKPPARRDGANGTSPPSYNEATTDRAPPSLPPRLPPRTAASGGLNGDAVNRLGAAGVSVPALGIGARSAANSASPSPPPSHSPSPSPGAGKWGVQVNELQGRFAKMGTSSRQGSPAQEQPSEGTTWAEKQAALRTASAFQKDPSSVSFSDAKAAAGTVNNFRQRHGDQIAAGARTASSLNQKYGVTGEPGVGAYAASQTTQPTQSKPSPPPLPGPSRQYTGAVNVNPAPPAAASGLAGKKKPPPPPPKKKPGLAATPSPQPASHGDAAPPIPMSTRPQF